MLLPSCLRVRCRYSNPRKTKLVMGLAKFLKLGLVAMFPRHGPRKNNRFQLLDNIPAFSLAGEEQGPLLFSKA